MKRRRFAVTWSMVIAVALWLSSPAAGKQAEVEQAEADLLQRAAENIEKYRKGEAVIRFRTESGAAVQGAQVQVTQATHDFLFGSIIFDLVWGEEGAYRPELFKRRFRELFNFAVFPFYWADYERKQGMPGWEKMLPVIQWCQASGITTKGHPLVWTAPSGKPEWLSAYPPGTVEELLKARVVNTVGGYQGLIDIWDVVNEPVNTRAWENTGAEPWMEEPLDKVAGLVEKSFKWAFSANPGAQLILNEFYTITKEQTRERFVRLVEELQRRDTPISGLGIQAHEPRSEWYPPERVWATFDRLAGLGYPLHITEFMPQSSGKEITGGWREGAWTAEAQAEFAEQFYRLSVGHPAVVSVNWWG
ncbi:MAG: endo-1,4-beta-xylanase, partial [Candidatus Glassbacteria bacterium]|nr:endo-1,4-beta-xylanase [Candidatus Glassbacteria bacterium]